MNKSRGPLIISVPLFFLFFFVLAGLPTRAQVVTNKAALQNASQQRALQEAAAQQRLTKTALEKGWPLTLRNKKGRLAYLRGINSSGLPYYVTTTDNLISAATIGTNKLWPNGSLGLSLNGSTAALRGKIAVWDEGKVRPTHVELNGRVIQVDNSSALSDHSTHVAGTMIAAGVNPLAKGMSFGAQQLQAYDFDGDESEMMSAAAGGLLVSNHSYADIAGWYFDDSQNRWEFWGNPGDTVDIRFGLYNEDAHIWDTIAYAAPDYLIAKAAGNNRGETGPAVGQTYYRMDSRGIFTNSGGRPGNISSNNSYNTIATYGNAKNILTLGAVSPIPGGYTSPSDVVLADFSSLGPTGDGRIKPDLVADGVNVLSSVSGSDNAYDIFSGTSMASPAAAGSSFLLQEYYYKLKGQFMHSATLKGLLIHTADEAGPKPGPDYVFGWGLINMGRAAAAITADNGDHSQQIIQGTISGTAPVTYRIVATGKVPVTATLCWTDIPGTPATIPAGSHNFADAGLKLVNDLDLRITDSASGKVFMPWVLNPASPGTAATKGNNFRDNVEKVELGDTLTPGNTYFITVSHTKALTGGAQAYALLISGDGAQPVCTSRSASGGASITQLALGGITNSTPSACRNYIDFSATPTLVAQLPVGASVPFTIGTGNSSCVGTDAGRIIKIFIDFNNDGVFDPVNELAYQSLPVQASTQPGNIIVPVTAVPGSFARMRIIAQETTNASDVQPCGVYGTGETQDYKVAFVNPPNDVGVTALEYPTMSTCASDSQLVSVHIRNFGSVTQAGGIQVLTTITGGATTINLSAICKDSILPGKDVIFTYNTTVATVAGTTYNYASKTVLNGDVNTSNDANVSTVTVSAATPAGTGNATICGTNATSVVLHATTTGVDIPVWYETATSTTPIAVGNNTTTSVITANKTYYMGLNDLTAKVGPANKLAYTTTGSNQGSYFRFGGNFILFTTSVPLTIESAKMYFAHSGQMTFTLATLNTYDNNTGAYSYF
ncbi:MAG: S8 family serine peptidase, partial [Bacteroidetes bacterium]|nr:S8 family serine peptidase [Bacteroidota bacterium]